MSSDEFVDREFVDREIDRVFALLICLLALDGRYGRLAADQAAVWRRWKMERLPHGE
jgi:hypothetical protein